jgi:hypothetical protein
MDDNLYPRVFQMGGRDIRFRPLTTDQIAAIQFMRTGERSLPMKVIGEVLQSALGEEGWSELITAMAAGKIQLKFLTGVLTEIVKRSAEKETPEPEHAEG